MPETSLWPTPQDPCYDCGSVFPGEHTGSCAFRDLDDHQVPNTPGTQYVTPEARADQLVRFKSL